VEQLPCNLDNVLPFDTVLMSDVVSPVAKLETPFVHDHFDENWYALLAELHVQQGFRQKITRQGRAVTP